MSLDEFRTKTGTCTLTDDRLLIERSGARGAFSAVVVLAIYTLFSLFLVGFGVWLLYRGSWAMGIANLLLAGLLTRGVLRGRGFSAAPEVPLAAIERIESHPPLPGIKRGHFVVHFQQDGAPCKRIIILPGILENGGEEFKKAAGKFAARGLLDG